MTGVLLQHRAWFRAVAVWLLLLAASPCTAPFSTFDLLPLEKTATLDAGKTKVSNDPIVMSPAAAGLPQATEIPAAPLSHTPLSWSAREWQHTVLRL